MEKQVHGWYSREVGWGGDQLKTARLLGPDP